MSQSIAIVGASKNRSKYGNKAVRAFKEGGWTVYPVNAKETEIEGLPCFARLEDIPGEVDRISLYVPPAIGRELLPEIAAKPHGELYLNPGSEDDMLVAAAKKIGLNPIQACSIVNIGLRPEMFPDE